MRPLVIAVAVLISTSSAAAQERTLFNPDVERGGFGGVVVKVTSIQHQAAVMVGGRGGWTINHSFVIGAGGYGVASEVDAPDGAVGNEGPLDMRFGYGGLELEYLIRPLSLGHVGLHTLVGSGATNYVHDIKSTPGNRAQVGGSDVVFVIEPGISAELNVTHRLRVQALVSYRFVNGVEQLLLRNHDLRGPTAAVGFTFGSF